MKLGVMQPYFFPYIGYFQLIHSVDRFILFDDVQYIRHGWINRNRILKPAEGTQYIIAPLEDHSRDTEIRHIRVKSGTEWKDKILRQLEHYKKRAPYYAAVHNLLNSCFDTQTESIAGLNGHCLKQVCDYVGIPFEIEISSQMGFNYEHVNDAGEWALRISEQLGAKEYINPPGGRDLFDPLKFERSSIMLTFIKPTLENYSQRRSIFEPGLSIIDVLMFNAPEKVKEMLEKYTLSA